MRQAAQHLNLNSVPHVSNQVDAVIVKLCELLVLATCRNRRVESNVPLAVRSYPLDSTIFHATAKDMIAVERMRNGQD